MNVLITGGNGYIGGYCVDLAKKARMHPVIVDNLSTSTKDDRHKDVPFYSINLQDEQGIRSILKKHKIDVVMHFAAYAYVEDSVIDPLRYYDNNLVGSLQLLKAMLAEGVKKMIFSSSCVVYGCPDVFPITENTAFNPINPYGSSKLFFEKVLEDSALAYNISAVSLRYFNASGAALDGSTGEPYDHNRVIPKILDTALGKRPYISIFGSDYPTSDGTCLRDYIHVLDLASAHILALKKLDTPGHQAYNLGTGKAYSIKELIQTAREITGKPIPSKEEARRPGDPAILYANPNKAIQELNWKIEHSDLQTILHSAWLWHSKQKWK